MYLMQISFQQIFPCIQHLVTDSTFTSVNTATMKTSCAICGPVCRSEENNKDHGERLLAVAAVRCLSMHLVLVMVMSTRCHAIRQAWLLLSFTHSMVKLCSIYTYSISTYSNVTFIVTKTLVKPHVW